LTAESIRRRGLRLVGWVGNSVDPEFERREENLLTLGARITAPCLGTFPYSPGSSVDDVAQVLAARVREFEPTARP
jgi:dethiobiotin synthetase